MDRYTLLSFAGIFVLIGFAWLASKNRKTLNWRLAIASGQTDDAGNQSLGFIRAFQAFPTIIFFLFPILVLYFYKIMPGIKRQKGFRIT